MTKEVDRPTIRSAGDDFFNVGGDLWRTAGKLDERPFYLGDSDWGYIGPDVAVPPYDDLRGGVRDFLRDGAEALSELRAVLYSVAARSEEAEEVSSAELDQIAKRIGQ